jgi:hypothetical protein
LTYSATSHAWWRIRETSGSVYWETSADGQTWTIQASALTTNLAFVCGIRPTFFTETWGSGSASPGEARYANFNVPPGGGVPPPVSTLVDSFAGSSINTSLWTVSQTAGTATEGGGSLNLTPNVGAPNTLVYLTSISQYSLVSSQAKVKLTSVPQGNVSTIFSLFKDWVPGEEIGWWYEMGTLYAYYLVAGVENDVAVLNYSPTAHAWLRIRHDGATVFWETSADGTNWTLRSSIAASSISYSSSPMNVMISVTGFGTGATSSTPARYANLN